jgi:diguanylate cyclase (GGDEF)-like protein/PAS domain S-box-containing protein
MSNDLHAILAELAAGRIPRTGLPEQLSAAESVQRLIAYLKEIQHFSLALANGNLTAPLPSASGPVAGSLKSLHAALKHLTWQTRQIADGDFSQRVDFMGEFSEAFNQMVAQLEKARADLESLNQQLQQDNTTLRNLTEALRESEERFRLITEHASDVIWTLDHAMQQFTYISPSIATLRGLTATEALQETLEQSMTPESLAVIRRTLGEMLKHNELKPSAQQASASIEVVQPCHDGQTIHVEVTVSPITDDTGRIKEFVGISRDISVRKKTEELLRHQSTHDPLTGLYNRAFLEQELERITASGIAPVSVIAADLDGLKRVNDNLGHEAGDSLIRGAADLLLLAFRGNDTVVRTGGDEFVVLLPGMEFSAAAISLERIRSCISLYNEGHPEEPVSMSLGAATALTVNDLSQAFKLADERMYADKVTRKQQRPD